MEDSGAILREISSLKDMLDQVNEDVEKNIQGTHEIEAEIVRHTETEKEYLLKESEFAMMVSTADFEHNGLIHVAAAARTSLESMEGDLRTHKMNLGIIKQRFSDKMQNFVSECGQFQVNTIEDSNEDLILLLQEKEALEAESQNLRMKINTLQHSTEEYIAEILEEIYGSNSVLEVDLQHGISVYMDVLKDIDNLKALFSSIS